MPSSNSRNEKKQVLDFIRRGCARIRANHRLRRLIPGFAAAVLIWLVGLLTTRLFALPYPTVLTSTLLAAGLLSASAYAMAGGRSDRQLLYVLDRMNNMDGTLLTWFHLHHTDNDQNVELSAVVDRRIGQWVRQHAALPGYRFPSRKASACAGLLLVGFAAQFVFPPLNRTPYGSAGPGIEPDPPDLAEVTPSRTDRPNPSSQTDHPRSGEDVKQKARRLLNRVEQLTRSRSTKDPDRDDATPLREQAKSLRRDLEELRTSLLDPESRSRSTDAGQNTGDKAGTARRKETTTSAEPERTAGVPSTDKNKQQKTAPSSTDDTSPGTRPEDRLQKRIDRAVARLNTLTRDLAGEAAPHADAADHSGGSGTAGKSTSSTDDTGDALTVDQLRKTWNPSSDRAVQTGEGTRHWPARYERTIKHYRSYLRTYFSSD